jgi:hypothetical protein
VNDNYLWDRSGPPDEDIVALERLLAPLAQRQPAPPLSGAAAPARRSPASLVMLPLAAAATIALAIVPLWRTAPPSAEGAAWTVVQSAGAASIGARAIDDQRRTLSIGQSLRTGPHGSASLELGSVGYIDVGPSTDVTLVPAPNGQARFRLDRGALRAFIWADPGRFFVETRSSLAVDLGCAYTLHVDARGEGVLRVTTGWVGFQMRDRQALIPAGAMCLTRPGIGPGTPYFEDAPAALATALETIDGSGAGAPARAAAVDTAIAAARPRDALTLWHLLQRVDGAARDRVYDRLAAFVPPPPGVTRDGVAAGNRRMLEQWWDHLGFGDTEWWHLMSRPWTEPAAR